MAERHPHLKSSRYDQSDLRIVGQASVKRSAKKIRKRLERRSWKRDNANA
jgi:hypothetical protein